MGPLQFQGIHSKNNTQNPGTISFYDMKYEMKINIWIVSFSNHIIKFLNSLKKNFKYKNYLAYLYFVKNKILSFLPINYLFEQNLFTSYDYSYISTFKPYLIYHYYFQSKLQLIQIKAYIIYYNQPENNILQLMLNYVFIKLKFDFKMLNFFEE